METVRNFWNQLDTAALYEEAKKVAIPMAATVAAGSLLGWTDPRALAVGVIAQRVFSTTGNELSKRLPSTVKQQLNESPRSLLAFHLLKGAAALWAGQQVAQAVGYNPSLWAMFAGNVVGTVLEVYRNMPSDDPFKGAEVMTVTQQNFQHEVLQSELPVVVDAYATWCPPCRAMAPIFSQLADDMKGQVKFVKFNVDQESELVQQLNITRMPTFLFYKDGVLKSNQEGGLPRDAMFNKINETLLQARVVS